MNPRRNNKTILQMLIVMIIVGTIILANVLFTMVTSIHFRSGVNVKDFKEPDISNSVVLRGNRGTIYDRGGEVIAEDEDTYTLVAIMDKNRKGIGGKPAYVQDIDATAKAISAKLDLDEQDVKNTLISARQKGLYQTEFGYKGKNLSNSVKESIEKLNLPGIEFEKSLIRTYPTGNFASHLIGYAQFNEKKNRIIGEMGLEKTLDKYLQGKDGLEVYQKDMYGNILPGTKYTQEYAENGNDVYMTLDRNVQLALQGSLEKTVKETKAKHGWGLVMEVETGKILGWASLPSFNLNKRDIKNYLNVPSEFLYEPGSVMKGITYAAAIDSGHYPYGETYRSGVFYYGTDEKGKIYRSPTKVGGMIPIYDAERRDHGTLTFDKGFAISSNIAICELLTNYMDPNIYKDYVVNRFNFTKKVNIPFVYNQAGSMNFKYASEKLSTGFGQSISVTALQMAQAYTAIFNDGAMMQPYVVDHIVDGNNGEIIKQYKPKVIGHPITQETSEYLRELMRKVIEDKEGTGFYRYKMDDVSVIAKTGTGEITDENGQYGNLFTNSIMAAAPADDPKIMVYYIFDSKDYSSYSGDPFKETMKAALIAENITGETSQQLNDNKNHYNEWEEYKMPALVNHRIEYANQKLKHKKVDVVTIGNGNSIVAQFPQENSNIYTNQKVFILTDGAKITMPNMKGWTKKDITAFWKLTQIEVEMKGSGMVDKQNIEPGTTLNKDSIIKVKLK